MRTVAKRSALFLRLSSSSGSTASARAAGLLRAFLPLEGAGASDLPKRAARSSNFSAFCN